MAVNVKIIITIAFFTLEFIAFFLSVTGNVIIIYVMTRDKKLEKKSNNYILSVAVADLLVGLVAIPLGVKNVSLLVSGQSEFIQAAINLSMEMLRASSTV